MLGETTSSPQGPTGSVWATDVTCKKSETLSLGLCVSLLFAFPWFRLSGPCVALLWWLFSGGPWGFWACRSSCLGVLFSLVFLCDVSSGSEHPTFRGTDPSTEKGLIRYPLQRRNLTRVSLLRPGMSKALLVLWCVLLGYYAPGYGSYVCSLVPFLYCRFHGSFSLSSTLRRLVSRVVAAAVSSSLSSRPLRRHFSLVLRHRQHWSTCLFQDLSRSLADATRRWRIAFSSGQTLPK